jgi:uncharacterized membrane protein YfcA
MFFNMEWSYQTIGILILIGILAGMISGFVGVGGGLVIVPALMYFLSLNQFQAQGTSLAVLMLPVGFLGVINYYKTGNVHVSYALFIAGAFILGSYFGSKMALRLPEYKVKFFFGLLMLYMAIQMIWKSGAKWWGEAQTPL